MTGSSQIKFLVVAMLACGLLTACGKRGPLEAPPTQEQIDRARNPDGTSRRPEGTRGPIQPPKRSLPIDFLLD
jgi:predicted small lipoprotein YifL